MNADIANVLRRRAREQTRTPVLKGGSDALDYFDLAGGSKYSSNVV
jgi:hypothetical protein